MTAATSHPTTIVGAAATIACSIRTIPPQIKTSKVLSFLLF